MTNYRTPGLAVAIVAGCCAAAGASAEPVAVASANLVNDASVQVAVLPTYPKRALKHNIGGEVTVDFVISPYGRALQPEIVSARPPRVFDNAVLDALKYWSFVPARPVACGTVEQRARQTFQFRPGDEHLVHLQPIEIEGLATLPRGERHASPELLRELEEAEQRISQVVSPRGLVVTKRVIAEYPERALERRKEGVVAVSFLIEKDGSVSEPQIVDSVGGAMFNGAALRAIRQWEFEPHYRDDGEAVERVGCHEFIFRADDYLVARREMERRRNTNMRVFETD